MKATDILKQEHRQIERLLNVLGIAAQRLRAGEEVPSGDLDDMIVFIRQFADGCHHHKEEELLFPALEKTGFPRNFGPVGVMLHEHDLGRALVAAMRKNLDGLRAGEPLAATAFAEAAEEFIGLLTDHIAKEDNILFAMADQRIAPADQRSLLDRFRGAEQDGPACSQQDALLRSLERLEGVYAAASAPMT